MANVHPIVDEDRELDINLDALQKIMTGKGLEYTIRMKQQRLENLCKIIKKNMDYIDNLIYVDTDVAEMKKHYAEWMSLCDEFLQIVEEDRVQLTDDKSLGCDYHWFKTCQDIFQIFKDRIHEWVLAKQRSDDSDNFS